MPSLFLNGVVGVELTADKVRNYLSNENSKEITVVINSVGGEVFEGLEIYNLLRNSGKKVTTVLIGLAASMGSVIFLAGDERVSMEGSMFMIHKPNTFEYGDADDLRKAADVLDKIQESIENIYKSRTEIKDLTDNVNKDGWFTVEEMLDNGITNSEKDIVLFDKVDQLAEGAEDMAKIDDLKAELEKQKKINAELEEEKEEAALEKEIAEMKAKNEQLANNSKNPTDEEEIEPIDEDDEELEEETEQETDELEDEEELEDDKKAAETTKTSEKSNKSKTRVIDAKKTKKVQNENKYPVFVQDTSKY